MENKFLTPYSAPNNRNASESFLWLIKLFLKLTPSDHKNGWGSVQFFGAFDHASAIINVTLIVITPNDNKTNKLQMREDSITLDLH